MTAAYTVRGLAYEKLGNIARAAPTSTRRWQFPPNTTMGNGRTTSPARLKELDSKESGGEQKK